MKYTFDCDRWGSSFSVPSKVVDKYIKLSDEIIEAVQTKVKEYMSGFTTINSIQLKEIVESRDLYYAKNLHGRTMLRQIQPTIVSEKCSRYFGNAYNELLKI